MIQKTPLSRVWFMSRGCKQVPLEYTKNIVRWAHPDGYLLNAHGLKVAQDFSPAMMRGDGGSKYPKDRATNKLSHHLMALTFHGPRPMFDDKWEITNDKCQMAHVGICHHLIPDKLNYRPANLLCWLTRAEHAEADRRQRALKKVVPFGDLSIFTYERLRDLQDPRSMSRELFEKELAAIEAQHLKLFDPHARMEYDMTHHCEC